MGCTQSKIENEEAVSRCKDRKLFMKEAVAARNAFAAAHSAYAVALKNTGAALNGYGEAEVQDIVGTSAAGDGAPSSSSAAAVKPPTDDTFPPPPPPPPDIHHSPLQRSASMPDLPPSKTRRRRATNDQPSLAEPSIREEQDGEDVEDDAHSDAPGMENDSSAPPPQPQPQPHPQPQPQPEPSRAPPPPPETKSMTWDYFFAMDENMHGSSLAEPVEIRHKKDDREEETDKYKRGSSAASTSLSVDADIAGVDEVPPPVTPEKVVPEPPPPPKHLKKQKGSVHHQYAASTGSADANKGKMVPVATPKVTMLQILRQLDDHFLKASQSAQEVSVMLEAARLHYHSNFADNRGHIDHSARVMRAITWNRSFKGLANPDDGKDDFETDESETHATILDKLLAWEKKLYDEVKASELMKLEYQRKVSVLNKQKKHGANSEALEKTKAAVSHLHTRYIVDMQSMDSTVSEIKHLRDDQLYPKLVALVDGMAKMWETMLGEHNSQCTIVSDIRAIDVSNAPKETSKQLYDVTKELCNIADEWHTQFQKLVNHQKEYIKALDNWLRLNLIPIESSLKEKVSSPPKVTHPPIHMLLHEWHDQLQKLPDERARSAILTFSAVIKAIMVQQQEEWKQKQRCEDLHKEYIKKKQAFEDWKQKYDMRRTPPSEEIDPEGTENANQKDPIAEKQFVVESLKKRLDDEVENHQKLCKQAREKSVYSLKSHLPELFRAMAEFAFGCREMYGSLRSMSQTQSGTVG